MSLASPTSPESEPSYAAEGPRWSARLALRFSRQHGKTVVQKEHFGPLVVQRPFYPTTDGGCHVYVIHPPGGVVGGDRLELDAALAPGARALLTTPGATKLYRTAGREAEQLIHFEVADGAAVEWLPQETIAFSGCRADLSTVVDLRGDGRFIGWEILCLGRPASRLPFVSGVVRQRLTLRRDGVPLLHERGVFEAGGPTTTSSWGLASDSVVATLAATLIDPSAVSAIRDAVGAVDRFAVTQLRGVLVCRYVGPSTRQARALFRTAWELIVPRIMNGAAVAPRIWAT